MEVERIGRRIISSKSVQTDDCELSKQLESLCKALEPFTKPLEHTHVSYFYFIITITSFDTLHQLETLPLRVNLISIENRY